jgi:hypothetical protein
MPVLIVLATLDAALADAWALQLPSEREPLRLATQPFPANRAPGFAAVVILDSAAEALIPASLEACPTIFVGEPRSLPFEQAKLSRRAKIFLSYEESTRRLGEVIPLLEEIAEKQSILELLTDRTNIAEPLRSPPRPAAGGEAAEWWDFLEAAVENFDHREHLISEFRRASRLILKASHAVFFLPDAEGFRADRGTSSFPRNDPLVGYLQSHPAVIDGTIWEHRTNPIAEMAVRNYLALWGARLLVPVHDNGRLLGLIALGVRNDGRGYDEEDRSRAISFARLLRHFLAKADEFKRLSHLATQGALASKYLPHTLILGSADPVPQHAPLVVREIIGKVRQDRESVKVAPTGSQPFRVTAGLIPETGGVWAFWEEASAEVHDTAIRSRSDRRGWLRELALTLSHELSNSLVSLGLLKKLETGQALPAPMFETVKTDIKQLEGLSRNLALMQTLHEVEASPVDIRLLAQEIGEDLGLRVEVGPEPVTLVIARELIDFALRSLITTVGENRPDRGLSELALQVRTSGRAADQTAMVSLKGKQLELEGVLPFPIEDAVPNLGRLGVFIAKEILRMHHGEIHAGPGIEGTEILFSFRSL